MGSETRPSVAFPVPTGRQACFVSITSYPIAELSITNRSTELTNETFEIENLKCLIAVAPVGDYPVFEGTSTPS